jgi:asparagine synthase (glutamine-hydrolysing)
MCGLTALFALKNDASDLIRSRLQKMNDAISHRGPDSAAVWFDPETPALGLGHRRLAILDLSPLGAQPMHSPSGRYVLVYNGEIYNHMDIQQELTRAGHSFLGHSDTEIFLHAIEEWGLEASLKKIAGMFACVLWDRTQKTLHLFKDRLGKKPLYVAWAGSDLAISSEIKSFLTHPDFKKDINKKSLQTYLAQGTTEAPHSIFRDVFSLPAGSLLSLNIKDLKVGQDLKPLTQEFWSLRHLYQNNQHQRQQYVSDAMVKEQFSLLFQQAVAQRMIADVPLGAFLSGGIDSSLVIAQMQFLSSKPVQSFSIGFDNKAHDEAPIARKIAAHLGTHHHEHYVTAADALACVEKLPHIYDEPFADASQIPMLLMAQFARQHVTVALSGDGGDELAGGYRRHVMGPKLWRILSSIPQSLRQMGSGILSHMDDRILQVFGANLPAKLNHFRHLLPAHDFAHFYDLLLAQPSSGDTLFADDFMKADRDNHFVDPQLSLAEQMIIWDILRYLPNDVLVKVDRATMAVALEARAPLLDHRLFEFMWAQSFSIKHRTENGRSVGKWILRQKLKEFFPSVLYEECFNRPKSGFTPPVAQWLRHDLKDWGAGLLSAKRLKQQGFWNVSAIEKMWQDHQSGRRNYEDQLWILLQFQNWYQTYME